jgi:hypothetical protein
MLDKKERTKIAECALIKRDKLLLLGPNILLKSPADLLYCRLGFRNIIIICKIRGFHGGDYEEWRLLGCDAT